MNRVLVVDDHSTMRDLLQLMLERAGYTVFLAAGARDAFKILDHSPIDVVLTDLLMPEGDGIELIVGIRQRRLSPCVVVMTSGGRLSSRTYATIARGFKPDWLLQKPFDREELLTVLQLVQARARLPSPPCTV